MTSAGKTSSPCPTFRLSLHFGLFQFLMSILGWFAGLQIAHLIDAASHWVAFGLLALVGGRMIKSGMSRGAKRRCGCRDGIWAHSEVADTDGLRHATAMHIRRARIQRSPAPYMIIAVPTGWFCSTDQERLHLRSPGSNKLCEVPHVHPASMRATRVLLRRRNHLVRWRADLLSHIQNTNSQYSLPEFGMKIGNAHPKWAFSEAATLFLRPNPAGLQYKTAAS